MIDDPIILAFSCAVVALALVLTVVSLGYVVVNKVRTRRERVNQS